MAQVLHVYKQVVLYRSKDNKGNTTAILSYDEKPGIQAIGNVGADLRPVPYTTGGGILTTNDTAPSLF
jgi:hypothetical protein